MKRTRTPSSQPNGGDRGQERVEPQVSWDSQEGTDPLSEPPTTGEEKGEVINTETMIPFPVGKSSTSGSLALVPASSGQATAELLLSRFLAASMGSLGHLLGLCRSGKGKQS